MPLKRSQVKILNTNIHIYIHIHIHIARDLHTVERDITTIMESSSDSETGLQLNVDKCEIITDDFTVISTLATLLI